MKPMTSSKGISSQDNGANQLKGSYTTRPPAPNIGKTGSFKTDPAMGTKTGGDALGKLVGRKGK